MEESARGNERQGSSLEVGGDPVTSEGSSSRRSRVESDERRLSDGRQTDVLGDTKSTMPILESILLIIYSLDVPTLANVKANRMRPQRGTWTIQRAGDLRERPKTECCLECSSYVGRPDACIFTWYVERVLRRVEANSKCQKSH
jgi:hypothetical protein